MKTYIKGIFPFPIPKASYQRLYFIFSILFIALALPSCKVVYPIVLGINTSPDSLSKEDLEKISTKRNIPLEQSYLMRDSLYFIAIHEQAKQEIALLKSDGVISPTDSVQIKEAKERFKNDRQTVQIRYFKNTGEPIFKMVGCYLDPFPMDWNVEGCLEAFPPKPISYLKDEKNDSLQFFLPHITTLNGEDVTMKQLPEVDYYAIVFWNKIVNKSSKKLINQIQEYDQQHKNQETYFLYVNNHNTLLKPILNGEAEEEIEKVQKKASQ